VSTHQLGLYHFLWVFWGMLRSAPFTQGACRAFFCGPRLLSASGQQLFRYLVYGIWYLVFGIRIYFASHVAIWGQLYAHEQSDNRRRATTMWLQAFELRSCSFSFQFSVTFWRFTVTQRTVSLQLKVRPYLSVCWK